MYSHLSYIPRNSRSGQKAKAHLGYIGNRPGKDGETLSRTLFGRDFGALTPEQVSQLIDSAPDNTLFWRLILNPDPVLENPDKSLDLRILTKEAVRWLEARLSTDALPRDMPFVAAIHDDHSPKAHIHGILLLQRHGRERPVTPEILQEFKAAVTTLALEQQRTRQARLALTIALSPSTELQQEAAIDTDAVSAGALDGATEEGGAGDSSAGADPDMSCPACLVGSIRRRPNSRVYECNSCGYALRLGVVIRRGRRKEAGRARSL